MFKGDEMFTNKPEFRVKEVIQLSKLSSDVLNDLLSEANVYLTKRILTYVLAQQISIQIASDRDLLQLRGYASELEDYTLLQLLNFTDAQGIEVDTFDIKFRLWTVIFNNLRELSIRDSWIQKHLESNDPYFEYTQDLFANLDRFIDEPNDIDGQPFIIAKESLMRFSSKEEVEMLAESIGVHIPVVLDKESTVNFILRDLEDTNPDLKNELMKKSLKEIEAFAKENYVNTEFKLTKKELVNYILDNYDQLDEHIRNIEYQKHLEIPSLYKYQSDESAKDAFKPNKVFDQELKEMIATIITGENDDQESLTEEKSKVELDKVMSDIAQTYSPPKREEDEVLLKRIDELEKRLQEKNNYDPNMISLMNKINNLENQMNPATYSREDMLLRKLNELEGKISGIARDEAQVSEAKLIEQSLLTKISELEERLSFQKGDQYIQKVTSQPASVQEPVVEQKVSEPMYEIDADDDYEYEVDHFIPKAPVIRDLADEVSSEEAVKEPENDTPLVEVSRESETEKKLLEKLAQIEAKLEERDTEIETLKEKVELNKNLVAEKESEEVLNAKQAQEEAERKLEEQNKELNLLRFLSANPESNDTEERDELLELEKLDAYTDDEEVDALYAPEEDLSESLEEDATSFEETEEVIENEIAEGNEITVSASDDDSVNDILEKIGVVAPKKKDDSTEQDDVVEETLEELELNEDDESLDDIVKDIENMEFDDEVSNLEYEIEGFETADDEDEEPRSEFDEFIEEIHSRKDSDKVKLRRRHTFKPITVFWKSLAIWAGLVIIAGVILVVYNNL